MKLSTQQIIKASMSKQPTKVQEVFNSMINQKIVRKIEAMKAEVGANLLNAKK